MNNKGIEYFTDLNCLPRFRKYHTKGIKNIWRVVITDNGHGEDKKFNWVMPYDTFHLAAMRFKAELSYYANMGKYWDTMINKVYIQCATYKDTELVGTERLNGDDVMKVRRM